MNSTAESSTDTNTIKRRFIKMAEQNCAHEECDCLVTDGKGIDKAGETFCSNFCAKAEAAGHSDECKCGHADCA
jgi:hypothetical protein